jgi:hypothetical protein
MIIKMKIKIMTVKCFCNSIRDKLLDALSFFVLVLSPDTSFHTFHRFNLFVLPEELLRATSNPSKYGKGYIFKFKKFIIILESTKGDKCSDDSHLILENIDKQVFLLIFSNWVRSQEKLRRLFF